MILKSGVSVTGSTVDELKAAVRASVGGLAVPDVIQITPDLPKTRSGKIMRRILRKIAANEVCVCVCASMCVSCLSVCACVCHVCPSVHVCVCLAVFPFSLLAV